MQAKIPESFQLSCRYFEDYPRKLICQTTYREAADKYIIKLDDVKSKLFPPVESEDEIQIPFHDLHLSGDRFKKMDFCKDEKLTKFLGDELFAVTPVGNIATRPDPLCRFIFFYAENSREHLKISRKILVRILTYHQVMPSYIDFLCVFGSQDEARGLRFSGFREQTLISKPVRGPAVPFLRRSGRQYQLCYNLKAANCISPEGTELREKQWSIRQAAIHHQFDIETGTSLWIVTKGDDEIKDRIEQMTGQDGDPEDRNYSSLEECLKRSLGTHMVYCYWSTEDWSSYVQWLEEYIDVETAAVFAPRDRSLPQFKFEPKNIQDVHSHEEKIHVMIMTLEANVKIIKQLKNFYERLFMDENFPLNKSCKGHVITFSDQLNVIMGDLDMEISRAKLLNQVIAHRKELVLQHIQAQDTEKMEGLTTSMGELGLMAQSEAIAMRIITVVTVIFLPATFVSALFSTDIVQFQNDGGWSMEALKGWVTLTVPLTVITLIFCYVFFKRSTRKKLERLRKMMLKHNTSEERVGEYHWSPEELKEIAV